MHYIRLEFKEIIEFHVFPYYVQQIKRIIKTAFIWEYFENF